MKRTIVGKALNTPVPPKNTVEKILEVITAVEKRKVVLFIMLSMIAVEKENESGKETMAKTPQ
jgi:hypothetical protein